MGLDITVKRIIKRPETIKDNWNYFRLIDNDGNYESKFPEWTKKFETIITEKWYNWEKYKQETGIDIKECTWLGEEYAEKALLFLWDNKYGKCPEPEDFVDGKNEDGSIKYNIEEYLKQKTLHTITVDFDKVPTYNKEITVIFYEEVGYQRKGLNSQFYKDYEEGKIGYYVWNLKELQRYKKEYCDKPFNQVYSNGEVGQKIYPKQNFQNNIINNFKEGECVVTFSW
jgi:hypothetical protein